MLLCKHHIVSYHNTSRISDMIWHLIFVIRVRMGGQGCCATPTVYDEAEYTWRYIEWLRVLVQISICTKCRERRCKSWSGFDRLVGVKGSEAGRKPVCTVLYNSAAWVHSDSGSILQVRVMLRLCGDGLKDSPWGKLSVIDQVKVDWYLSC